MRTKKVAAFAGLTAILAGAGTSVAQAQTVTKESSTSVVKTASDVKKPSTTELRRKGTSRIFAVPKDHVYKNVNGKLVPLQQASNDFDLWTNFQPVATHSEEDKKRWGYDKKLEKPSFSSKERFKEQLCDYRYKPRRYSPVSVFNSDGERVYGGYWIAKCDREPQAPKTVVTMSNKKPLVVSPLMFEQSVVKFKKGRVEDTNRPVVSMVRTVDKYDRPVYLPDNIDWSKEDSLKVALEDSFSVNHKGANYGRKFFGSKAPENFAKWEDGARRPRQSMYAFRLIFPNGDVSTDLHYVDTNEVWIDRNEMVKVS